MTMKVARCGKTLARFIEQPARVPSRLTTVALSVGKHRHFYASARKLVIKPVPLADIGEGIREVQIIQWFVEPEARVEQFQKIVEVQSDKASVEITAMYDGVIKKLNYSTEEIAQVGKPLYEMDIQQEISPEDEAILANGGQEWSEPSQLLAEQAASDTKATEVPASAIEDISTPAEPKSRFASLATPAVRHLLKEHDLKIEDITGTGKDGRVLKEDVQTHMASTSSPSSHPATPIATATQTETHIPLTAIQSVMFKNMTRSLQTPHFLYTDTIDLTTLTALRHRLSAHPSSPFKISSLAFIIKAVSISLSRYPLLNARFDTSDPSKPRLFHRSHHNIGIAMDTPHGLLVPNIKNVAALSISEIATHLLQLAAAAKAGKLSPGDLTGGTITVTNIGSIGGGVVAPVIVPGEVAILGVGKARSTPVFDETGAVARAEMCAFSWSADHRVVDGATLARCSEVVRGYLEGVERMVLDLR